MPGKMLLLVVLALVIQVFGATTPYWTEVFVVENTPSIGGGAKIGLEVGASNRLTIKPFDETAHVNMLLCGAIFPSGQKPRYAPPKSKGCRAKVLCDKTDMPEAPNPFSICLLDGNAFKYCDSRNIKNFEDCDQDDLQGVGQKQKPKQIVIDYKSQVNHNQQKEIVVSMVFLGRPDALTIKSRRLDPTKKVNDAELISCDALVAKPLRSLEFQEGDCSVILSCNGPGNYRTCRLPKQDNRLHYCGNEEVTQSLTPCTPERLSQTNDEFDSAERYKAPLVGRNHDAMVSIRTREEEGRAPRLRRTLSAKLADRVEQIVPCSELFTEAGDPLSKPSSGGLDEPCHVRLSCAGERDDYTCRIANRKSMDLANCGPNREQYLPPCTDEWLRLREDDDC